MKTAENYSKLVDSVFEVPIPSSPDWNRQFREKLKEKGLTLSMTFEEAEKPFYPHSIPILAPWPFGEDEGWPRNSFIVWDNSSDS